MTVRLSDLTRDRRTIIVTVGDGVDVRLTYRPSALNAKLEEESRKLSAEGRILGGLAHQLAEIVESWDVTGDDEAPVEPSEEVFATLGLDFTRGVFDAIRRDLDPNQKAAGS